MLVLDFLVCIPFQYRKRYEITCDSKKTWLGKVNMWSFNTASGMRSHVTADRVELRGRAFGFNTASGMRSHVTKQWSCIRANRRSFNTASGMRSHVTGEWSPFDTWILYVSIPQAVWDHMWRLKTIINKTGRAKVSIPQAVWDHMWLLRCLPFPTWYTLSFNTASGMRSHVT